MKNKILVEIYVPSLDNHFDIWIPLNDTVGSVLEAICKSIKDLSDDNLVYDGGYAIIDADSATAYDLNSAIKDTNIRNGKKLILL